MARDTPTDALAVALSFTSLLERHGIPYLVGGSLASSVHGEPRSTNDVDVIADLHGGNLDTFLEAVSGEYYVSPGAARQAVQSGASFNVIHLGGMVKVDVFVAGDDPFNEERLKRRQEVQITVDPPASVYVDTAEHSVLRKLEWFRRGGEVSERQWRDVVTILRLQAGRLDQHRLEHWADQLGVSDLLKRAVDEASSE
jgi:hypothetical protein